MVIYAWRLTSGFFQALSKATTTMIFRQFTKKNDEDIEKNHAIGYVIILP